MTEFTHESGDMIDDAAQSDVPDIEEQLSQGQEGDTLVERGLDDALDEGYSPPERYSSAERFGNTAEEMREGETFEERLRQEVPEENIIYGAGDDESALDVPPEDDFLADGEVGDSRAGRLVDPDAGIGIDVEKDLVGDDVGIDGAGASAEEAAVHIIDE
ncbi:MAG: hypothetical protein H0U36_13560 [Nocardioidaceae bacterium]|nr:hypothetical protein [Nocardioidaceae bacterium]